MRWFTMHRAITRQNRRGATPLLTAVILAVLVPATLRAAGPYDGTWRGATKGTLGAGCYTTTAAMLTVQGDRATGEDAISSGSRMPVGKFAVTGGVSANGAFTGKVGDWDLRGKFSGDTFEGDYEFGPCTMVMRLNRVQ